MTNPRDPRPLRAVTEPEPGGPTATTSHRAGSSNHQDTTNSDHGENNMSTSDPAAGHDYPEALTADELYERWRELGHATLEVAAAAVMISVLSVLAGSGVLVELMNQFGNWGWFGAGAGAAMLLDIALTALGRLSRAGWLVWLTYHPVPVWAPVWVRLAAAGGQR